MSTAGIVTVQDLINQIREEADQQSSGFVSDLAIATHISNSGKELYDILVGAYGNDYFLAPPASFNTNNINDTFPLPDGVLQFNDNYQNPFTPAPFYKLAGLDLQLGQRHPGAADDAPAWADRDGYGRLQDTDSVESPVGSVLVPCACARDRAEPAVRGHGG